MAAGARCQKSFSSTDVAQEGVDSIILSVRYFSIKIDGKLALESKGRDRSTMSKLVSLHKMHQD